MYPSPGSIGTLQKDGGSDGFYIHLPCFLFLLCLYFGTYIVSLYWVAYFYIFKDLHDYLLELEEEFNRLHESINKRSGKGSIDSGLPKSMRNSNEDQYYLKQGARS